MKKCCLPTSEIYGDPEIQSQNEFYWGRVNPIDRRSKGKDEKETLFFDYYRHKLKIKIGRILHKDVPAMVELLHLYSALKNKDIQFMYDGKQTRSFCLC